VSEKAKAKTRRYHYSDKGQAWRANYKVSGKRDEVLRRYNQSPKGRESAIRGVTRRRLAMKKVPITLTAEQWHEILRQYDYRCAYCGKRGGRLERDHVVAITRGGAHIKENIVPACRSCNARKSNRVLA
jgi:5-methylcytosine-specific restriction endonuclease McrA